MIFKTSVFMESVVWRSGTPFAKWLDTCRREHPESCLLLEDGEENTLGELCDWRLIRDQFDTDFANPLGVFVAAGQHGWVAARDGSTPTITD